MCQPQVYEHRTSSKVLRAHMCCGHLICIGPPPGPKFRFGQEGRKTWRNCWKSAVNIWNPKVLGILEVATLAGQLLAASEIEDILPGACHTGQHAIQDAETDAVVTIRDHTAGAQFDQGEVQTTTSRPEMRQANVEGFSQTPPVWRATTLPRAKCAAAGEPKVFTARRNKCQKQPESSEPVSRL